MTTGAEPELAVVLIPIQVSEYPVETSMPMEEIAEAAIIQFITAEPELAAATKPILTS